MKTLIVGKDMSFHRNDKLSHAKCVELSKLSNIAAIVSLEETPSGLQMIYQDGVLRQYDPVNNEIIGAAQPFRGRIGHSS